jgi:hypothetical protein
MSAMPIEEMEAWARVVKKRVETRDFIKLIATAISV